MENENPKGKKSSYGKRPIWQWLGIYAVIAVVLYGAIYYFFLHKNNSISYQPQQQTNSSMYTKTQVSPAAQATKGKNVITIQSFAFSPATIKVKPGDSITWTNQDSVGHSATANDNSFDTGVIQPGQSKTLTFSKAGTFIYHCSVHPYMQATVIVQ